MKPFTVADLFCGSGGMSLGFQNAGFENSAAFDACPISIKTYNKNVAEVALCEDITKLTLKKFLKACGGKSPDVIIGGPPCQGFSLQNRHFDAQDKRNDLVGVACSIIRGAKPKVFVLENVSAVMGKRGDDYRKYIESRLSGTYTIDYCVLQASDFGVPQRRKRAFAVGIRLDINPETPYEFPEPTTADKPVTVRKAFRGLKRKAEGTPTHHTEGQMSDLNRERFSHVPPGGGWKDVPRKLRYECQAERDPDEGGGWPDVFGRLRWDLPSSTITAGSLSVTRGRFGHPSEDRAITPREAARLQTFPDTFVFEGTRTSVCRQIGNAVPVLLAQALAESLIPVLGGKKR